SSDLANGHVQNLGTITTVDVSKSNPNVIYCGTDDANVWVTTNGGSNWTKINNGLPYRWVTRVTVHKDSANVCYVTLSGYKVDSLGSHIYRTSNFGSAWQSVSGNLPNAPINDVVLGFSEGTLYIGTDVGVMTTTNYGANWFILDTGIPSSVPCHDLTLHASTGKLVVFTHGRSAYATSIPVGIVKNTETAKEFMLYQNYPNPFNPKTKIRFNIPPLEGGRGRIVSLIIYDVLGREISTLINNQLQPGSYEIDFDASYLSSGVYFYRLVSEGYTLTRTMILIK
ncbi:MAG TPA: T9SS type A sorting domain-containing protein, partial [Ignavibacteria bacterium]|nr:T9SS type A sorting domain-containing protein [Ignavibacteria bacterium]